MVAAFGLFCLLAGLVGGIALYVIAERRPAQSVDGFARAPIGCNTTLEFAETGIFYVFEEIGADPADIANGCQPVADPTARFSVEFDGESTPARITGAVGISYDTGGYDGRSVQLVEIVEPGLYTIAVTGDDLAVAAAIGRDPDDGVEELRRAALILAGAGAGLGLLLLTLSGRRSKRAASAPGTKQFAAGPSMVGGPITGQVPVNPHAPPAPPSGVNWQPPTGESADDVGATELPPPVEGPVLPDVPGRTSGT